MSSLDYFNKEVEALNVRIDRKESAIDAAVRDGSPPSVIEGLKKDVNDLTSEKMMVMSDRRLHLKNSAAAQGKHPESSACVCHVFPAPSLKLTPPPFSFNLLCPLQQPSSFPRPKVSTPFP